MASFLRMFMIFILLLGFPIIAQAQTDAVLTFSAEDGSFSLAYPAGWEITESGGDSVTFSAPIPATGVGQSGGIQVETDALPIIMRVSAAGKNQLSAADFALAELNRAIVGEAIVTDPQNLLLNDQPLAVVDGLADPFDNRLMVWDLGAGNFASVWLFGAAEQFATATLPILEILNSVRLNSDTTPLSSLTLAIADGTLYARPSEPVAFAVPVGWLASEEDTYTLLTIPNNDVTVGISGDFADPITETVAVDRVNDVMLSVEQDVPTATVGEVSEFAVTDLPAARVLIIDESGIGFAYVVTGIGQDVYANMTVIGSLENVLLLEPTILALAYSLEVPESTQTQPTPQANPNGLPLTQAFTSTDGTLTFQYPEGWLTYDLEGVVIVSNNDTLVQSGDLNNIADGDIVVFVIPTLAELPEYALSVLPEDVTPMDVVMAISSEAENAGAALTREKVVLGGHSAAISYGTDTVFDILDIAILMESGEIASLLTFFRVGGLAAYQDLVVALADSLQIAE